MMEFGYSELFLIGLIALLVIGPKRLPELARQAGSWIGKAKRFVNSVRADVEREFHAEDLKRMLSEQQDEIKELKGMISETQAEVEAEAQLTKKPAKASKEQAGANPRPSPADDIRDKPESTALRQRKGEE